MFLTLDDFEPAARRRLPRPLFGYISGAAETGAARQDNRDALDAWRLVPNVLRGVEGRSTACTLLGESYAAPFGVAPMGLSALMARDGDVALARAAAAAGLPFVLSGSSLTRMEDVVKANPKAWFQAYLPGEEDRIRALIARVRTAGFGTLVLTRAYADWSADVNAGYRDQLVGRAVDLVQLFPAAAYGKNGADIRLAVDAVEDMFRLPDLTHVVIVAGDSDYIALAQRCKRLGRYVVGIGVAGAGAIAAAASVGIGAWAAGLVAAEARHVSTARAISMEPPVSAFKHASMRGRKCRRIRSRWKVEG